MLILSRKPFATVWRRGIFKAVLVWFCLAGSAVCRAGELPPIQTVFLIVMENHDWSAIRDGANAPFINGTLLPMASYCEEYYNPPGLHPSEPNYLWLEAGTNFGITDDAGPDANHQAGTNHLITQLRAAGVSWKTYQEDIDGATVPLTAVNNYQPKHNPFVYFDDITGTNNPQDPYALAHIRPYSELASDLAGNTVARYNFITPNMCNDMHDSCAPLSNPILQGDTWLAAAIPPILASDAYRNGGAIFITWDEGAPDDGPIGMIVLSPLARGGGFFTRAHYTHSSMLRTLQEIFRVGPFLGDAANTVDMGELFCRYQWNHIARAPGGPAELTAGGVIPGRTNVVHASSDLRSWTPILTNVSATNGFTIIDSGATNCGARFYRLTQTP